MSSSAIIKMRLFGFWASVIFVAGGCASRRGPDATANTLFDTLFNAAIFILAPLLVFIVARVLWRVRGADNRQSLQSLAGWLRARVRQIPSVGPRLRAWWNGVETRPLPPSRIRSLAYDNLVRSQLRVDPAETEGTVARLVPSPFREAFDHPRSRVDVDASWFAPDLLGRAGLAVAVAVMLLALLMVALATGVYQPPRGPTPLPERGPAPFPEMRDGPLPQGKAPARN